MRVGEVKEMPVGVAKKIAKLLNRIKSKRPLTEKQEEDLGRAEWTIEQHKKGKKVSSGW